MQANLLQQNIKRFIAASLAVWLSGVMFLFCCESPIAQATGAESCPLAKMSHCSKRSVAKTDLQIASLATENQLFDCCRFPAQIFDKARKIETIQQTAELTTNVNVQSPKFTFVKTEYKFPELYQSFVRNRGSTHLRNCIFRI